MKRIIAVFVILLLFSTFVLPAESKLSVRTMVQAFGGSPISYTALSHDGALLFTAHKAGYVNVFNRESGKMLHVLSGHESRVILIHVSRDNQRLLTMDESGKVLFRKIGTWEVIREKALSEDVDVYEMYGTDKFSSPVVSGDMRYLLCGTSSHHILLWDIRQDRVTLQGDIESGTRHDFKYEIDNPANITIDDRNQYVVSDYYSVNEGCMPLFEIDHGQLELVKKYPPNHWEADIIKISPDGRYVVAADENEEIRVLNFRTGQLMQTHMFENEDIEQIIITPDSRHLIVLREDVDVPGYSDVCALTAMELPALREISTLKYAENLHVQLESDHLYATLLSDHYIESWKMPLKSFLGGIPIEAGAALTAVAQDQSKRATRSYFKDISVSKDEKQVDIQVKDGDHSRTIFLPFPPGISDPDIDHCRISPDGASIAFILNDRLGLYDLRNNQILWSDPIDFDSDYPFLFLEDGSHLLFSNDNSPSLWNTETLQCIHQSETDGALTHDGGYVNISGDLGFDKATNAWRFVHVFTGDTLKVEKSFLNDVQNAMNVDDEYLHWGDEPVFIANKGSWLVLFDEVQRIDRAWVWDLPNRKLVSHFALNDNDGLENCYLLADGNHLVSDRFIYHLRHGNIMAVNPWSQGLLLPNRPLMTERMPVVFNSHEIRFAYPYLMTDQHTLIVRHDPGGNRNVKRLDLNTGTMMNLKISGSFLTITPDERRVITRLNDVFDLKTGKVIQKQRWPNALDDYSLPDPYNHRKCRIFLPDEQLNIMVRYPDHYSTSDPPDSLFLVDMQTNQIKAGFLLKEWKTERYGGYMRYALSDDHRLLILHLVDWNNEKDIFRVIDTQKKQIVETIELPVKGVRPISFLDYPFTIFSDNRRLILCEPHYKRKEKGSSRYNRKNFIRIVNLHTGQTLRSFQVDHHLYNPTLTFDNDYLVGIHDKIPGIYEGNKIDVIDLDSGRLIHTLDAQEQVISDLVVPDDMSKLYSLGRQDGSIKVWRFEDGKLLATIYLFRDASVVVTPEGYFSGHGDYEAFVHFVRGTDVYDLDQFYTTFYRPEMVNLALAGENLPQAGSISELLAAKPAPGVKIVSPKSGKSVDSDLIELQIRTEDNGGGIGDVNVFVNGTLVATKTRGIKIKSKKAPKHVMAITVPLAPGSNTLRAVAFNADGSIESKPDEIRVTCKVEYHKPMLHALVVGIDTYRNKKLALNYAVSDAAAFSDTLNKFSSPLFERIEITALTTPEETTREHIVQVFEQFKALVKPQDLFVFYNASHGVIDVVEGQEQYFLLPSNILLLSSRHLSRDAISQKELIRLVGDVPAQKKLIILDTCHSGKAGAELQMAMLQTRGLTEAAAIKILQRAVGSAVFTAASEVQPALEGYKGNGLFTWALLQGMSGEADYNKDGFVKIRELADFVEENVILISEDVFQRQQTPIIEIGGNTFPLARIE